MALHHSGRNELLKVHTDKVTLLIKGPCTHPKLEGREKSAQISAIKVNCSDQTEVNVWEGQDPNRISPLFFEQQNYEIIIQHDGTKNVEFWHVNRSLRESVEPVYGADNESSNLLSGVINFRGNIGLSELVVKIDGRDYLTIVLEVYPIKLDYKEDYIALLDDLTKEVYNLIFEFLRETYTGFQIGTEKSNSLVEFWEIIKHIFADYIKAADMIISQPHHVLEKQYNVVPAYKFPKTDNKSLRWLATHSQHVKKDAQGYHIDKVLSVKKVVTYDTKENRFTKFILQSAVKRLDEFRKSYLAMDRVKEKGPDETVMKELNHMMAGINRRLNSSFFKSVSDFNGQSQLLLVFTMAPGYRDLFRYYMMLQHGLSLAGDIYHMSVKDLAEIYEYWCFVKLNSLLKKKYKLTSKDIIRINSTGLFVTMVKSKRKSKVTYQTEAGEKIELSYNPSGLFPTGPQKPDNVLSIEKQGAGIKYQYVFDAKYRVNPALPDSYYSRNISGTPGPEEDDINTMHRYRDAIVSDHNKTTPYERIMFGAYVLFPLSKHNHDIEEYKNHKFYKSIQDVNIGGLPFLPSTTDYVETLLDELINAKPEDAYTDTVFPAGSQEMIKIYQAFQRLSKAEQRDIASYMLNGEEHFNMDVKM